MHAHDATTLPAHPDTPVRIARLDLDDADLVHRAYVATEESYRHGREFSTFLSEPELLAELHADPAVELVEPWIATVGGEVAGTCWLWLPQADNRDKVYAGIQVRPSLRHRGVGSALVEHAVERVRAAGRTLIIVDSWYPVDAGPDHAHRRFAARHGFRLGNEEVRRILTLPVPDALLDALDAESDPARRAAPYRVETFRNDVPEHLLESYVHLLNQLAADAPTGEIEFEAEQVPVAAYLGNVERAKAAGRTTYRSIAVHTRPDGTEEAVAHSTLACPAPGADVPNAYQWGTLVRNDHRGHRLGTAVKVANLRALQADRPDRRVLTTTNSAVNGPMVAINERLGFRPVDLTAELVRRV
ncbi:MAG TPA: GNAT family N-acetyltransferase [Nocardioidaceae bacterium]|nr:GNAT family N-acetyltransferase [Nocardioidaceae bacterium]